MRRPQLLAVALVTMAGVVMTSGCGSKPASSASGPSTLPAAVGQQPVITTAPLTVVTSVAPTTTAPKPSTTLKHTPDCDAYRAFSLIVGNMYFLPIGADGVANKQAVFDALDATAEAFKKQAPTFAADVAIQVEMAKKFGNGQKVTADDQAKTVKAGEASATWYNQTCA